MNTTRTSARADILIAADTPAQAEALRLLLDEAGFTVRVARSGIGALAELRAKSADLVISDVILALMTGFELCRALRADEDLRDTPFILLTGLGDALDVVRGLECGADNYVTKPYDPEQLLRRIERTLASRRRRSAGATGPIEITFLGSQFTIASDREQILDVLISSFEDVVRINASLHAAEEERDLLDAREGQARSDAEDARVLAENANNAKSEFLAMMSHDLRTPLNAIGGFAELLTLGIRGPVNDAQIGDLERIRRNQRHLLTLVNDVLSFARLETGEIPLSMTTTPLDRIVRPMGAVIAPQVRARNIVYEFVGCDEDIVVLADSERLEQILINLLGNAVKFTPDGGRITLRCTVIGNAGVVEVTDTGIGIPARQADAIFDAFVQVDNNRGKREGVGLGLAISRKLARAMGGDVTVRSVENVGSTFSLILPLAAHESIGE